MCAVLQTAAGKAEEDGCLGSSTCCIVLIDTYHVSQLAVKLSAGGANGCTTLGASFDSPRMHAQNESAPDSLLSLWHQR